MKPSVRDRIADARRTLKAAGLPADAANFDAEVLARHALGWDRAALLTRGIEPEPDDFSARYHRLITRRAAREPVALITGRREFYGRDFEVTADVLIPRPETEFIVEEVLAQAAAGHRPKRLVDVGTGSGCLAVTLARELPETVGIATDISAAALRVARRNARRHGVERRVRFLCTDLLAGLGSQADLIVSNPPYVPRQSALQPEIARYEPAEALYGGGDGLVVIRQLLATAPAHLSPGGRLVFEFGDGQEDDACAIATSLGWRILNVRNDLQGLARVAVLGREA